MPGLSCFGWGMDCAYEERFRVRFRYQSKHLPGVLDAPSLELPIIFCILAVVSALPHPASPMNRLRFYVFAYLMFSASPCADICAQPITAAFGERIDIDIYGNIYLLQTNRNSLELLTKERIYKRGVGGSGWENDQFDRPSGVWARNGIDVFVADYGNHRIQRFDRNLNYVSTLSTRENPNPDERFGYPSDVALSRLGYLFICDTENSRIVKVNQYTQVERTFGGFGAGEGRLYAPTQVECGPKDHVYVVDGARLLMFDNFGNFLRVIAGVFHPPLSLYADDRSVVVVDSVAAYCFDNEDRPVCSKRLEPDLGVKGGDVRSIALSQDSMFVLTRNGVFAVADPRQILEER